MNRSLFNRFIISFTILLTVFTGCSKTNDSSGPAKPLVLWVYDKGRIDVLTEIGKQFEEKYGVPVEVSLVDLAQIRTQFVLAEGGAECADLAIIPHDNLGGFVENAAVMPLKLGSKEKLFLKQAVEGFTYNGKLYGMPLAVENIGFFRNTDMVPDAPATWDDAIRIGTELVNRKKAEVIMGLPDATYNAFPVYTCFGGEIFGKKSNGSYDAAKINIAADGMVKGLALMTDLVKKNLIPDAIDWDAAHVLFESGKAPFIMTGPWALNRFKTAGVHYSISAFPAAVKGGVSGAPFMGVQGIVISSASKQAMLAKAFAVDFIGTEENMRKIFDAEPRPSAMKSIFESISDSDSKGFQEAGKNASIMPSLPAMGYVWDSWKAAAELSFSGQKSPEEALKGAKMQIETQIKENTKK